jgi:hypothetical protein
VSRMANVARTEHPANVALVALSSIGGMFSLI